MNTKTKIWPTDGIKNHLLAVSAWLQSRNWATTISDNDKYITAYTQGGKATLMYLAPRFGLNLSDQHALNARETGELRTWGRSDIKVILQDAFWLMNQGPSAQCQTDSSISHYYKLGVQETIHALARSFGIAISIDKPGLGGP